MKLTLLKIIIIIIIGYTLNNFTPHLTIAIIDHEKFNNFKLSTWKLTPGYTVVVLWLWKVLENSRIHDMLQISQMFVARKVLPRVHQAPQSYKLPNKHKVVEWRGSKASFLPSEGLPLFEGLEPWGAEAQKLGHGCECWSRPCGHNRV